MSYEYNNTSKILEGQDANQSMNSQQL